MASSSFLKLFLVLALLLGSLFSLGRAAKGDPLSARVVAASHSDGKRGFQARIPVNGGTGTDFLLDASSSSVSLTKCSSSTKAANVSFVQDNWQGSLGDSVPVRVGVACSTATGSKNVLGFGPGSSFLRQVWSSQMLRPIFSYCLTQRGEIAFGRTNYRLFYNGDVLNATFATLVDRIPFKVRGSSYSLGLTGVGLVGSNMLRSKANVEVGATSRYSSLPEAEYKFLRTSVMAAAAKLKLKQEATTFGELDLCYRITPSQVSSFPKLVMEFGGSTTKWSVWPENYLVPKPGTQDVVCFGMVFSTSPVIGTLQQQENWVEYDLGNMTLGVTGYIPSILGLSCGATVGT